MTQTPEKAPRQGGRTRVLLIASLTLNLLVVGIVLGGMIARRDGPPRPPVGDISIGAFTEALTHEDRRRMWKEAMSAGLDFRAMRKAVQTEHKALLAALRAETWDASALTAVFDANNARIRERMDLGQRLLAERVAEMSLEERRAFADRFEAALRRGPPGPPRRDDRGPRPGMGPGPDPAGRAPVGPQGDAPMPVPPDMPEAPAPEAPAPEVPDMPAAQ
ncbi:periplasmic heavy metal sensor [Phaeovulum vinaykumarii]|uniref:Uncharacterized membrane protein n=1 Tax=Phaeovulum vinaykumarii TaxID=407234 RepID=A0A1N7KVG8_9RHOB|nr:periplasmic heavy metal sensor [Phaeovulum vinaykumarii]SIS65603.1 Uncharacterized membrane protein [Phaeovulum vinaykumarii]SOC01232.1 uncharacterized membrane protein [Phaeovulum vinaykumarii]